MSQLMAPAASQHHCLEDDYSSSGVPQRCQRSHGCQPLRPNVSRDKSNSNFMISILLLEQAAIELQHMKQCGCQDNYGLHRFPSACYHLVKSLPGNDKCMDCGSCHADWATTSYGAVLCLQCSAHHRSLGVETSKVRSLILDHWSHEQVLSMLEGGNQQLYHFFDRHHLTSDDDDGSGNNRTVPKSSVNVVVPWQFHRYRTKAARFYRKGLDRHVSQVVASNSLYQGREASRQQTVTVMSSNNHRSTSCDFIQS